MKRNRMPRAIAFEKRGHHFVSKQASFPAQRGAQVGCFRFDPYVIRISASLRI